MLQDASVSLDTDQSLYLCPDQPVLVAAGVVYAYATIIRCDVTRRGGEREGVTWINGRQAGVLQRFPGYDPSYEWVFFGWVDLM